MRKINLQSPTNCRKQNNALQTGNAKTNNLRHTLRWMALVLVLLGGAVRAQMQDGSCATKSFIISPSANNLMNDYSLQNGKLWFRFISTQKDNIISMFQDLSQNGNFVSDLKIYEDTTTNPTLTYSFSSNSEHFSRLFEDLEINRNYYVKLNSLNNSTNLNLKIGVGLPTVQAASIPICNMLTGGGFENGVPSPPVFTIDQTSGTVGTVQSNSNPLITNPFGIASEGSKFLNVNLIGNSLMFHITKPVCAGETYRISFNFKNVNRDPIQGNRLPFFNLSYGASSTSMITTGDYVAYYTQNASYWQYTTFNWTAPTNISNPTLRINFNSALLPFHIPFTSQVWISSPIPGHWTTVNNYGTPVNQLDIFGCDLGIDEFKIEPLNVQKPILKINSTDLSVFGTSPLMTICSDELLNISSTNDVAGVATDGSKIKYEYSTDGFTYTAFTNSPGVSSISNYQAPCTIGNLLFVTVKPNCAADECSNQTISTMYVRIVPKPTIYLTNTGPFCNPSVLPNLTCSLTCNPSLTYTYQWYNGVTPITGATSANYQPTQTGDYTVKIGYNYSLWYGGYGYCTSASYHVDVLTVCPCDLGYTPASYNYNTDFTISDDITWTPTTTIVNGVNVSYPGPAISNGTILVNCKITVAVGKNFTIDPGVTVLMGNNGKIVVKRGALPNIGGAAFYAKASTITGITSPVNSNLGCMWQGIDVQGFNAQATTLDGSITLVGCNIEHAICGVYFGNRPAGATWATANATNVGGNCVITGSFFKNNYISVYFPYGNTTMEKNSYINGTEFKCTAPVRQPDLCFNNNATNPSKRSVAFIKSIGWYFLTGLLDHCGFRNTNDQTTPTFYSLGTTNNTIAMDMTASVFKPSYCTFSTVEKGIWLKYMLLSSGASGQMKATCNTFEYVRKGILITGSTANNFIVRNKFTKGLPTIAGSNTQVAAAVTLDGARTTEVINNTIVDYPNAIMCFNTGTSAVTISRNTISYTPNSTTFNFSNKTGMLLGGINNKAKLRCNTLGNGYTYGIKYITQFQWNSTAASTIAVGNQGSAGSEIAGNLFGNTTIGGVVKDLGRSSNTGSVGNYYFNSLWAGTQPTYLQNLILGTNVISNNNLGSTYSGFCTNASTGAATTLAPAPPVNCFNNSFVFNSSPIEKEVTIPEINKMRKIPEIQYDIDNSEDEFNLEKLYSELVLAYEVNDKDNDAELFLQSLNEPEADEKLVDLYMKQAEYTDAATLLATMPDGEMDELAYKELYSIFVDLGLQNRNIDQITENEKQLIEAVHGLDVKASGVAISILSNYFGWDYTLSCEKLGECDASNSRHAGGSATDKFNAALAKVKTDRFANASKGQETVNTAQTSTLFVAPNPANNTTVLYYRSKSNVDVVNIVLTDVNGQKVFNQVINGGNGKFELPTNNLSNGIYNVMLQSSNGSFATQKLIINH